MLELKNITKVYKSANEEVTALKGVSIQFRKSEFVSILGQSGCGKTTLLNIIGGLDRYTSGDLIINGKSTKKFKDRDWDSYRNYKVGFVFQSYNLIFHQTVLSNVELALTIGGVSKRERRKRAKKALADVGLKEQMHKKPNQLSGGQMQRVAIARALVNDPDIILADEPTGALDTKTSVQVMEILKKISKDKLIVMVTHNPELAESYSSRIIRIVDGVITEDSNPPEKDELKEKNNNDKIGKASMKLWTAFRLSLNNLLTKKGRTALVAVAGSIGIIGIALVQSVSNGFQAYVDQIQEDALTSYPLAIMQETTDVAGMLLSMVAENGSDEKSDTVKEEQYISKMLANLTTNDLKSFSNYLSEHYNEVDDDLANIMYSYSIEPNIYSRYNDEKILKLNPSNLFQSSLSDSSMMGAFSSSIYSQMIDDKEKLSESYEMLAGHWPEKYDEMVIVLTDSNSISDLLVYSLGLRDIDELKDIVMKIMNGEKTEISNEPMETTYDDLMKTELKLIMPSDIYKYNEKYDIYEDMKDDEDYFNQLYDNAIPLKIVGIVTAKEGTTTTALNPGVAYTSDLVKYIINYASETEIVKKQIENDEVDIISGVRFDSKENKNGIDFKDLISVDADALQSAFDIKIDQKQMENETEAYMYDIVNSINTDTSPAKNDFSSTLNTLVSGIFDSIEGEFGSEDIETITKNYLNEYEPSSLISELSSKYNVPKEVFKTTYSGLLNGLLQMYVTAYTATAGLVGPDSIDWDAILPEGYESLSEEELEELKQQYLEQIMNNLSDKAVVDDTMKEQIISMFLDNATISETISTMSKAMTEAKVKTEVMSKVAELVGNLTSKFASSFNVDQEKIASAFKVNSNEDEIKRIITAMFSNKEKNVTSNLISLGYQDIEKPTYISFFFKSFEGKENFKKFIDDYNEKVNEEGDKDKEINYTDTTGILMDSVKTIVNAVTYVLISFISISLVVSSFMIGIITYISVYERTKEIGILRAIGASKKNISSIFNAETFIIGLLSGLFGVGITYSLIPLINKILHYFTGNISLSAAFYAKNAVTLVILSIILTLIGGLIPAKAAAKRDPVVALRTE